MRLFDRLAIVALCCVIWATPLAAQQITAVNAASYSKHGLPSGGIAQGSLFVVFGEELGPSQMAHAEPWPFPLTLAGTTVEVEIDGLITNCFLVHSSKHQAAAILPSGTALGEGTVTVRYNGSVAGSGPITVVPHSFGIFTTRQSGWGQAVATDPLADAQIYSIASSAKPGELIDVWGTGLGPVEFNDEGEPEAGDLGYEVKVFIAGLEVPAVYAGRSGCCSAVDIVRIIAPDITGCFLPLTVFVDGIPSNYGSVSIDSSGEACEYDPRFGPLDISSLHEGDERTTGSIQLMKSSTLEPRPDGVDVSGAISFESAHDQESARAVYERTDVSDPSRFEDLQAVSKLGACTVLPANPTRIVAVTRLDPGDELELIRPFGYRGQLTKQLGGAFYTELFDHLGYITRYDEETPPPPLGAKALIQPITGFFQYGIHTVTAPGGADVAAHEAAIDIPRGLVWLNRRAIGTAVQRDQPLLVQYAASAYDYVQISGFASLAGHDADVWFACAADASAGSFTVPADVLAALPDTPLNSDDARVGTGALIVTGYRSVPFEAAGTDYNTLTYISTVIQRDVDFN